MAWYSVEENFIIINIKVTPAAKHNKIEVTDNDLKISVNAIAENGKANKAVIEILSDFLKIPKTSLLLAKGNHSKEKKFMVKKKYLEHFTSIG